MSTPLAIGAIAALAAASQLSKRRRSGSPALSLEQILAMAEEAKKAAPSKAQTRTRRPELTWTALATDKIRTAAEKMRIVELVRARRIGEARALSESTAQRYVQQHAPGWDWLPTDEQKRLDLTGADLAGADLSNADLSDANLTGANLTGANLTGANLHQAHLNRANLTKSNLSGANLNQARLEHANLRGADLQAATLHLANLDGASLRGANLYQADLDMALLHWAGETDPPPEIDLGPDRIFKGIPAGYRIRRRSGRDNGLVVAPYREFEGD